MNDFKAALQAALRSYDTTMRQAGLLQLALSPEAIEQIAAVATESKLAPGKPVLARGRDEFGELFFVIEGELEVDFGIPGHEGTLTIPAGQFCGIMAILTRGNTCIRTADVTTKTAVRLAVINPGNLAPAAMSDLMDIANFHRSRIQGDAQMLEELSDEASAGHAPAAR